MCVQIFFSMALLAVSTEVAAAYSDGLVAASCGNLLPVHDNFNSQTSQSPYNISASIYTYNPGDRITVTLDAPSNLPYRGFMLQARLVGSPVPLGSFVSFNTTLAQGLDCKNLTNSSVSHRSNVAKTQLKITWEAPLNTSLGDFEFCATFVKAYDEFWGPQISQRIISASSPSGRDVSPYKYILLAVIGLLLNYC